MRAHIAIGLAAVVLAGCTADPAVPPASTSSPAGAMCPVTPRNVTSNPDPDRFGYQVTNPAGTLLVGGADENGTVMSGPLQATQDGWHGSKFGWWRGVAGTLTITGRRLDGDAQPARAHIPDGYGSRGFQATGVDFPMAGCWELTGRVADAALTFVVSVVTR